MLTREILSHAKYVRATHGVREVATAPAHGIAIRPVLIHEPSGLRFRLSDKRAHSGVRRIAHEQVNVIGEYRLGEHLHSGALPSSSHGTGHSVDVESPDSAHSPPRVPDDVGVKSDRVVRPSSPHVTSSRW